MDFTTGFPIELIPAAIAFVLSAAIFPFYIRWLKAKQLGQYIREDGPQSHAAKAKTPTMGGLCFIAVSAVVSTGSLILGHIYRINSLVDLQVVHALWGAGVVLGVAVLCGLVGFLDDYGKVTSQSNKGLSAKLRLLAESALGGLLAVLLFGLHSFVRPEAFLPISIGYTGLHIAAIYILIMAPFLITATTNAINLHDGMDGLSAGTSIQVFIVLAAMLSLSGHVALALVASSMVGALAGFLIYNRYPAKVFMGDTGSLYIGGLMAALVVAGGLVLWFIPLSLLYIAEAVSVMAQVSYFKLTKAYTPDTPMSKPALIIFKLTHRLPGEGKRLFRMAPLHHHFEAIAEERGISEWKVVAAFWIVQFVLCAIVLACFLKFGM